MLLKPAVWCFGRAERANSTAVENGSVVWVFQSSTRPVGRRGNFVNSFRLTNAAIVLAAGSLVSAGVLAQAKPGSEPGKSRHGAQYTMVKPNDLKWNNLPSIEGASIAVIEGQLSQAGPFTVRLKLPANSRIPPHTHPGIEHVTVMSGTFQLGHGEKFEESKLTALPAGSMAIMQPGHPHFVLVKEETILQLHGMGPWKVNYIDPADDPAKKKQ